MFNAIRVASRSAASARALSRPTAAARAPWMTGFARTVVSEYKVSGFSLDRKRVYNVIFLS